MKKFEKWLKNIFILLFRLLAPKVEKSKFNTKWIDFQRILIFRLDNRLGNSILVLSLLQSIRKSLPLTKVDVLMTSSYTDLYKNHPDISTVIPYDQKYLFRNPFRFIVLIKQLRKYNYDVVFSSSNPDSLSISQAIFCRLVTRGRSVGFDWKESSLLYSDVVKGDTHIHYARVQVDLWKYFDKKAEYYPPRLFFLAKNVPRTENSLLIWLGATGNKIVGEGLIQTLVRICEELKIDYLLAAGPHDQQVIDRYSSELKKKIQLMDLNLTSIGEFYTKFKIICMPDTGPMHLVAALGLPLIQIFVHSNIEQYGYRGKTRYLIDKEIDEDSLRNFMKEHMV
jgi:ADP-heptose:LPS heptosyltransferase